MRGKVTVTLRVTKPDTETLTWITSDRTTGLAEGLSISRCGPFVYRSHRPVWSFSRRSMRRPPSGPDANDDRFAQRHFASTPDGPHRRTGQSNAASSKPGPATSRHRCQAPSALSTTRRGPSPPCRRHPAGLSNAADADSRGSKGSKNLGHWHANLPGATEHPAQASETRASVAPANRHFGHACLSDSRRFALRFCRSPSTGVWRICRPASSVGTANRSKAADEISFPLPASIRS